MDRQSTAHALMSAVIQLMLRELQLQSSYTYMCTYRPICVPIDLYVPQFRHKSSTFITQLAFISLNESSFYLY